MIRVWLGPELELHEGIHGSLRDHPPPGVRYRQGPCTHEFAYAGRLMFPADPLSMLARWEAIDPGAIVEGELVHASRVPVGGAAPWLADADCLLATLQYGRAFALGAWPAIRDGRVDPRRVMARERAMLARYLAPRCAGVLFHTEHARGALLRHVASERLLSPGDEERLAAKSGVVRPTIPPASDRPRGGRRPIVVYAGRAAGSKGGDLALAALTRLGAEHPGCELHWVGERAAGPAAGITFHPFLPRRRWLDLLASADVLFSPTPAESYGMALVEAACSGAALVTTRGPGMEHVGELFEDGRNALLVSNALAPPARVRAFAAALAALCRDGARRRAMSAANLALAREGVLSIRRRDEALLGWYARGLRAKARAEDRPPLRRVRIPEAVLRLELRARTHVRDALQLPPARRCT